MHLGRDEGSATWSSSGFHLKAGPAPTGVVLGGFRWFGFLFGRSGRLKRIVPWSCPLEAEFFVLAPSLLDTSPKGSSDGRGLPFIQQQSDPARGHGTLVRRWCAPLAIGWSFVAVYQVRMNGGIRQVGGVTFWWGWWFGRWRCGAFDPFDGLRAGRSGPDVAVTCQWRGWVGGECCCAGGCGRPISLWSLKTVEKRGRRTRP